MPVSLVPIDHVDVGELVIEDSDNDEPPDSGTHARSASSTLQLVRTHLRRHISQDSLSKRKSRSAVGSSQEEIERRAELKRLRHKRIQEELSSEDDNKAPLGEASIQRQHGASIEVLPHGGPRDTIEFSMVTDDSRIDCDTQGVSPPAEHTKHPSPTSPTPGNTGGSSLEARRASSPQSLPRATSQNLVRTRHSLPQMSPDPLSRRSSTFNDGCSLVSWRLSYNAGQLDEFLGYPDAEEASRILQSPQGLQISPDGTALDLLSATIPVSNLLSRSHSSPARQGTPDNEDSIEIGNDQSPLSTWLRSQGLQSAASSFRGAGESDDGNDSEGSIQQAEVVVLRRCSSVQNLAVRETDVSSPEAVHLYDMDIDNQLATRCLNTEDVIYQSGSGGASDKARSSKDRTASHDRCGPKDKMPENDSRTATINGKSATLGIFTSSSSVYPSTANTAVPTPDVSSPHTPDWVVNKGYASPFSIPGFSWLDNANNPFLGNNSDGSSRRTGKDSNTPADTPATTTANRQRSLRSQLPTPPLSTQHRETSRAERIMGKFRLGQGAPATLSGHGRFHKGRGRLPPVPESEKPSLLARLHLTLPRKAKLAAKTYDGPGPDTRHRPVLARRPLPLFVDHHRPVHSRGSANKYPSPYSPSRAYGLSDPDDDTAELWQRAIQKEARLRHSPPSGPGSHARRSSLPDDDIRRKTQEFTPRLRHHRSSIVSSGRALNTTHPMTPISPLAGARPYLSPPQSGSDESPVESPSEMRRRGTESRGTVASQSSSTKEHRRQFSRIPDSWARFSSHTRAERSGSAPNTEDATPTDVSPQPWSEQDAGDHSVDSGMESSQQSPKSVQRSISGRFGKAVVVGLSKLIHSKSSPGHSSPRSDKSHRKSFDRRRHLEYPELVLPPNEDVHEELKALEQQVHHLKGAPRVSCPRAICGTSDDTAISLSPKMASLLHTDGAFEAAADDPTTPAPVGVYSKGSATTSTDRFVTPMSSLSPDHGSGSSFHSYDNSRPHSRISVQVPAEGLVEGETDAGSGTSPTTSPQSRTTVDAESSGGSDSTTRPANSESGDGPRKEYPLLTVNRLGDSEGTEGIDWSYQSSGGKHLSLRGVSSEREKLDGVASGGLVASD
ncbi:hypothetical protein QBC39DRAFT_108410 [Podospora conica]|nr:hypothetical protein QBC39DRAFT_108410 [Schizothecium conicum]